MSWPRRAKSPERARWGTTTAWMSCAAPPNVVLGSHDPLPEWALRQSKSGLASFLDGNCDGLTRFANAEGSMAGIHIADAGSDAWNVPAVSNLLDSQPVVLTQS